MVDVDGGKAGHTVEDAPRVFGVVENDSAHAFG